MSVPYTPPIFRGKAFNCPHCGAYAAMKWYDLWTQNAGMVQDLEIARCTNCNRYSVWREKKMLYPSTGAAPLPNAHLPENIRDDYEEARDILSRSPRGAAALLRLAIQKLCTFLVQGEDDLNAAIGILVKRGLNVQVQQALDAVRVVGNNAVHPGQIDLKDSPETSERLFELVNIIAEAMISQPKRVAEMYEKLSEGQREQIANRDGASASDASSPDD